jgi:hypothetical protein
MGLVFTGVIAFALASYLSLIRAESRCTIRSQTWNVTIPIIEAGIEEAMAHLNCHGTTNLVINGWREEGDLVVMRRSLGFGRYVVSINRALSPLIECIGFVPAPPMYYTDSGGVLFAQAGQTTTGSRSEVYRAVRVQTRSGSMFGRTILAKGEIDFSGNNVGMDSFDSMDPNFSTNGQYDSNKRKDNGDVATNSGLINSIKVGNANIYGRVSTGPGGAMSIGANGAVGSLAWMAAGNHSVQDGWSADDMNASFLDIEPPSSAGYTPSGGTISITNIIRSYASVTTTTFPWPIPAGGVVINYDFTTSATYPASPPDDGVVVTNFVSMTNGVLPNPLPAGGVVTNLATAVALSYPAGAAIGPVITNLFETNTFLAPVPWPSGSVTTNLVAATVRCSLSTMPDAPPSVPPSWQPPAPGTFVGTVTNRYVETGTPANRGWFHDYAAIASYSYFIRTFTYTAAQAYVYTVPTYTYHVPMSFTYTSCTATNTTVTTETYDYILDSYGYVLTTPLSGRVCVRGNATLYCRTGISLVGGQDGITILPGGSLNLFVDGPVNIGGKGVMNQGGNATNLFLFGLPGCDSISIRGNGSFVGAIYAPSADVILSGSGNNEEGFVGAIVAAYTKLNGHFKFHYDENLGRIGPRGRYTVFSWNEVPLKDTRLSILGLSLAGP